jgi:pimeloyl-ACP methyl ester carboxylesterase/glycine cleavage system regulatory protein
METDDTGAAPTVIPAMAADLLSWCHIKVDGRGATYGVGGEGAPVVFLHGWALGSRAYKRAVLRLIRRGCAVYAPAMPGFGGTADLPSVKMTIDGYAGWVDAFMTEIGIQGAALVIGHSFGGGVAVQLAHTYPERVGYLVLLNSVGGVTDGPPWEWAIRLAREMLPTRTSIETMVAMRDDLLANLVRNPLGLVRAGHLARTADLRAQLAELRRRGLPVLALTTEGDGVIPQAAFEALCEAVGTEGYVLSGRHSWLLADPDTFGEVLANVVEVRVAGHQATVASGRVAELAEALRMTTIPRRFGRALLGKAPALWLMSAAPAVLAGDLALCHPKLRRDEVRAVARPIAGSDWVRLTVVASDRPGLFADSAAVLAGHGISIVEASAVTWPERGLALHAITVAGADSLDDQTWSRLGDDLRSMGTAGGQLRPRFVPAGRATVTASGTGPGQTLVRVTAPDQVGLLWAICRWLADRSLSIDSLHAATQDAMARDVFLVSGSATVGDLAGHLSRASHRLPPRWGYGYRERSSRATTNV